MQLKVTKSLNTSFSSEKEMMRTYGLLTKKIKSVLDAFGQVNDLEELKSRYASLEELKGNRKGTFSIRLNANWRLIFEPDWKSENAENFLKEDGGINYPSVTCVTILSVEDYH